MDAATGNNLMLPAIRDFRSVHAGRFEKSQDGSHTFKQFMFSRKFAGYNAQNKNVKANIASTTEFLRTVGAIFSAIFAVAVVGVAALAATKFIATAVTIGVIALAAFSLMARIFAPIYLALNLADRVQVLISEGNSDALKDCLLSTHFIVLDSAWEDGLIDERLLSLTLRTLNKFGNYYQNNDTSPFQDFAIDLQAQYKEAIQARLATLV